MSDRTDDMNPWDLGTGELHRVRAADYRPASAPTLRATLPTPVSGSAATPMAECPGCHGAGFYMLAVPFDHPQFGKLQRCECMAGTMPPAQVRELARLNAELGRYAQCTFAAFYTRPDRRPLAPVAWDGAEIAAEDQRTLLRAALETSRAYAETLTGWLYLYGSYGAGKSHLAAAVLNRAAERGIVGCYVSVPSLIDYVHDGFQDNSASTRLDTLATVPLLVLDDLGAQYMKPGGKAEETLFKLINTRDVTDRPTVITGNVHPDAAPGRISSRIAGRAQLLWLPVSDYRRKP